MRVARVVCILALITLSDVAVAGARSRTVRRVPSPLTSGSLLWIAAHPDDEVLVAPILAQSCVARASRCTILVLTRGEAGDCLLPGGCHPDVATVRQHEMEASAASFGATLVSWGFSDGGGNEAGEQWFLEAGGRGPFVGKLAAAIDDARTEVILTFSARHGSTCHVDHRVLGALVEEALQTLGSRAPAAWTLESVAEIASNPFSIGFRPSINGTFRFDANQEIEGTSGWSWLLATARLHPSQFDAAWLSAIEGVAEEERAVHLLPLGNLLRDAVPDVCH